MNIFDDAPREAALAVAPVYQNETLPTASGLAAQGRRRAVTCGDCAARSHGLCHHLPEATAARLRAIAAEVDAPADHWFWGEDSDPRFVGVVRSGYLRLLSYSEDGRRMITGIAGPGAIVGASAPRRGGYGLESSTAVKMCVFDRAGFAKLVREEATLRRAVIAEQNRCLRTLQCHIWSRGLLTPEERLATFLLRARGTLPYQPLPDGGGVLTLDIPRADIADLLGTTRETISRLTHQWQERGLIALPDARHLVIRDVEGLALKGGQTRASRPIEAAHPSAGVLSAQMPGTRLAPGAMASEGGILPGDPLALPLDAAQAHRHYL